MTNTAISPQLGTGRQEGGLELVGGDLESARAKSWKANGLILQREE